MATQKGELLGSGKEAEVYAFGGNVLKLQRPHASKASAFREAAILALVEELRLPAPRVIAVGQTGGRWGIEMTRAPGPPFAEKMMEPGGFAALLPDVIALHQLIHGAPGAGLMSLKARLGVRLQFLGGHPARLDEHLRRRLIAALAAMPDGDRVCHGDFHPFNIMGEPGSAVIVDWLDAACGDPAADVCRTYLLIGTVDETAATAYVDAYAAATAMSTADIYRWLPFVAAARLAENVPEETARLLALANRLAPG